ncbi:MAG TPA: hypothetical protein VL500_06140 [Candidatus Eisenbacteria bacterium]|nr:hypothetical protein [Candidatus Eisenbacteria bacterium]
MSKVAMFAIGALLLSACAHSQTPPPAAVQPPPAHQADAPPPAPDPAPAPAAPNGNRFSLTPSAGWVGLPSSMVPEGMSAVIVNPQQHAMLMIMVEAPASMSANDAATQLRTQLAAPPNAWTCSPITAWPDASGASFTTTQGAQRGKLTVRRMHENPSVNILFMGRWPAANAAAMRADYDAMVSGATLQ